MNKIFKTKYDVTTGQTKAVSELASNRQVASSSGEKPKCDVFFGGNLGAFKVLPLALLMLGLLSSVAYGDNDNVYHWDQGEGSYIAPYKDGVHEGKNKESVLITKKENTAGLEVNKARKNNASFKHTVAVGSRTVVGGHGATSIGYKAIAGSNVNKSNVDDYNQEMTAIGYRVFANGDSSTAIGNEATAWGDNSIAIGSDNAKGDGKDNRAERALSYDVWRLVHDKRKDFLYTADYATTKEEINDYQNYLSFKNGDQESKNRLKKSHTWARGHNAISIGSRSIAYGNDSTAMGTLALAIGNYSTSLGAFSMAFGEKSIAIGNETYVYKSGSVGVGNGVQAISDGSIVYGLESYAGGLGSIAIGTRALSNVETSDNFKEKTKESVFGVTAIYDDVSTVGKLDELDTAKPNDYFKPKVVGQEGSGEEKANSNTKTGGLAIGYYALAYGENALALGRQVYAKGERSIAIGPYAYAKAEKTAALGYGSKAIGEQSMALGSLSRAEGNNSIAIGINSAVKNESNSDKRNGLNTLAIGNETEATMDNSVALGYKSHTKYFYQDTNKNTATLTGKDAISLEPYVPEGSSYNLRTDKSAGIVSVGWTKDGNKLGLRRIIGVAPGALDSDVATIGQLKALAYVKKDGTPYKDLGHIDANNVFVGPKGEDEKTRTEMKASKEYSLGDMGKKIKFAHILDGEIKSGSDQAVTGNQLYSVKDVLGVELNQNTTLKRPSFGAVNYVNGGKRVTETFKDALTDTINAINSGYKFSDGDSTNIAKNTPFYLGSTLEIKAGDIQTTHKSTNLKTKLTLEDTNSKAVFTIGLSDTPTFKKVMLDNENAPTDNKELVNKKYVDDKFQNVATSFNVAGDSGDFKVTNRLDIKGDTNISTKASTNEVKISLQEALTGIASVMGKNGGTKIEFTNDGLTLNSKKITGLQDGNNDTDAVTFKQLNDSKLHFLSVHDEGKNKGNYNNDGAKAANSVAIGVDVEAQTGADSAVLVGHSLSTNVKNSVVVGSNINIEQEEKDRKFRKDAVVAIGSGLKLKNAKSSIVIGAVDERSKADNSPTNDEWRTVIEDATWSVVLGNKTKIKNGDDVLALGNNIIAKGTVQGKISGLVILGNRAKATDAKNSVVIGTSAESKAESAVVLGHEAKVESAAGDSIALGKGSKATKKEIAPSEAKSSKDVKFAWTAGIGGDKSVVSIGDSDKERQIKHVAAGVVTSASTDAINGSQLYAVADEFSKLAVDVLGAEKADNDKTGFKKSTFTAVNYQGSKNKSPQTFRDAINESIAAINKGLKFAGNEGTAFTSQLGVTVNIKGDGTDLSSKAENNAIIFALHKADKVEANNDKVVTSKAVHTEISKVTQELNNAEISYKANGTSEQKVKLTDGFNFTNSDNITAEVKDKGVVKFKLNDTLQNITSISGKADNGTAPQIDFANQEGLKISSQGVEATFKTGGLHLNDKQLKGVNSGLGLPANGGNSTEITNKVLAGTPDNDSNAVNVKDLSTVAKAIVDKGLTFKGDSGVDIARKLGETLTIKGEKDYTETVTNGAEMTVKLTQGVKDKLGVITVEGDKLAIGKDSTLEEKGTAFNGADINVGIKNSLKFNWTGGVSADDTEQNKKSVISVGSDDKERIITHVAAGKVSNDSTDAINGSQLAEVIRVFGNLGTDILGGEVDPVTKTFKASTFDKLKDESGTDTAVKAQTTFKGAIDSLIATVNKGLIFAGNTGEFTRQIGAKITIEGENGDITTTANIGNITLKLNKAYKVLESDEKVVTSKAVAEELKKYTSTATLDKNFLKVDGSNIGGNQSKFGENVGISKINLENGKKSTTELVQAKAVIDYLKGMGTGSVKISDNPETKAEGEGSIAVGDKAIAQNAGAVAIGQNAGAKNAGAISIGKDSDVTSIDGVALGRKNVVGGQSSIAIGETNTVSGVQSYVIGSDNDIKGREVVAIGSNITADEKIHDAVILGKGSTGEAKTVSVGSTDTKRRIIFVDTPTGEYDAANKKYVDERGLKFKGNEENQTELVNLDKLLTIDSSEANKYDKGKKEKDIKTKVEKEGDGAKLTLTLNKADEVSEHDERAVSSKAVHSALQAAKAEADKTAVKYDDPTKSSITLGGKSAKNYRPVAIDNLKSGLGIDDIKDVGITSAAQGKQGELVKDLVAGKLDTTKDARGKEIDNLHKAVNLADLKAVAQAGLNFAGNDEQDIHKNLGEKLDIVGQGLTKDTVANFKGTNGNIAVKADSTKTKLEVSLSEDLKGLKSAEFKGKDGNTVKIDGDAIVLNDKDGKPIATLNKDGLTINGKDGQSAVSLTTKNENGKDAATLAFAKGEDGQAGTGAITGLKDLADNADGSSATNKNYVDNQLKKAKEDADKTAVKYDDETRDVITLGGKGTSHKPVVIDNLRSGLGIDDINDGGIASIKQGKTRDLVKDLVAGKLDEKAHKAANVSDLKAVATAGLNFAGNDSDHLVHKNLGETLQIAGQGVRDVNKFKATDNNIVVKTQNDRLEVALNAQLTGLQSATFANGQKTVEITGDKIVLKDGANSTATYTADSATLTDKDGNTAQLNGQGLTVGDDKSANGDKTHTTYGKNGLTIHGKDGQSAVSLTTKKDAATLAFAKDGQSGTGAITGLKDLEANADGSSAANKNYVDEKVSDLDSNRPFDFYIQEGDDYTKVVKGRDGKFYKPEDLKGAKYVAGTADGDKGKYTKNGQDVKSSIADKQAAVVIKAEPTTSPMTITNVKDGDLTNTSTDAINGGQLVKATGAKFIDDPSSTTDPKAKKMVFADGKDGLSGLEKLLDGKTPMANKGLTAKDGLNGKNANDKANALRNGEAGTVVFTDKDGNRLVKANDGKYYKATDVDDKGNVKSAANGQVAPKAVDNPQLSLVNTGGETDKPVVLGNVASGLGIDADKAKEHAENVKNAGEAVKTEAQAVAKKVDDMLTLQTAKEAKQDAIDALETALSFMPETTPEEKAAKEKAKAKIEGEKSTLADINSKLDKAKKEVESAQGILKTKQEAYQTALKAKDGAVNKLLSGDASVDVHRGANLQDLQALGQAGLNFEGNDGVPVHKNLGEKLTIKGEGEFNSATTAAGNIKVEASETGLEVKLSDKLKNMTSFETREVDGKQARLDSSGLSVQNKTGKEQAKLSENRLAFYENGALGLNLDGKSRALRMGEQEIIKVSERGEALVSDLSPHSSGQTIANKNYVDSQLGAAINRLDNVISTNNRNLQAGIAGANAAAALPTVAIPGKSTVALSAGTYKGRNAVAIGYSRLSDNGKITLKLHGNSNSVGDFGGGVGVGWTW